MPMNTKINSFLPDFKTQLNLSEQEQTTLAGFFQFLINRKSPQNIFAHYGLLVQYEDKHTLQTFLELLEQSLHELSSTYRLLNASEKNFSKASLSAQKLGEDDIFVLTDCSETNNMMHIISEFEKTPQLIKIVCATPAVVEQRFRKNENFFYRLLPRHIHLGEAHSKEITAQFLSLLSSKGYTTTKEFDDEIAYYIESIYETADFQNQKFLQDLLRRIELQMQETNGLPAYKEGQAIDISFVPYSKRASMRKEKEKKQADKPEYKITELKSPLSDPPISIPTTPANSSSQATNVLLLSLSTFSRSIRTSRFDYHWRGCEGTVIGRYQLDPVVKMLATVLATKNQTLDKIVMLCTDDTQNEVKLKTAETEEIISISPLEYFKKQIRAYMNPNLEDEERFVPISVNLDSPFEGIQNVIQTLRTIQNSERGLTLYLDTHGGLRGVQRVLEATVSLLKIEDINIEEAFAVQFSDSNDEPQKNNLITLETENMEIFNFVSGINEFISCGRADILMDYVNSQKKISTQDNSFVNAILDVTNGIQWCCVPAFETGLKTLQTYFEKEKPASTDTSKNETSYLEIYKNDIKQNYKNLLSTTSTVIDEINWCLQKGFYQQALTLIEARISFLLVEQWHVFKVNDKYNISEENNTVYYDIRDGKEPVTLNELFNAYVYKIIKPKRFRKSDQDILFVQPDDFYTLFSDYTGENDNYLSTKDFYKKMYDLNDIPQNTDFKSVLSTASRYAQLPKKRSASDCIVLSPELTIDEDLLLAILILHKALKEVRNDMNHASAGFTHNLDSISVVLRHYIKWIEELGRSINPKEK